METVNEKFGRPMERDRDGHTGGGQLFMVRRESAMRSGVLSTKGHSDNYLAFRPANFFMRILGDDVLRLNEALFDFRARGVEHLVLMDDNGLQAYYGELRRRMEVIRDRVAGLVAYCNKGFDGRLEDAREMAEKWASEAGEDAAGGAQEMKAFGPLGPDVYESVRQRNVEEGVLTEAGSAEGFVAFRSCPFYGRVVGEIVFSLNDALRRVEDRTPQYIASGQVEAVREYYVGLMRGMKPLRAEIDEALTFCRGEVDPVAVAAGAS